MDSHDADEALNEDEPQTLPAEGNACTSSRVPNPEGKNQYQHCPRKNDPFLQKILTQYHHDNITNRSKISRLLQAEHGIVMSEATVARRRQQFGLLGSGQLTRLLPRSIKRQLVLDQLARDPLHRRGPRLVREAIVADTGNLLTRKYVTDEMRQHEPDGFAQRGLSKKKISRQPLVSLGPHHQWSGDGHDKLSRIGFPIWAIRDQWSGKWLGMWVVPNNRLKTSIAYLYLSLVHELGGMPLQTTTDCGSETTDVYGFATALREIFSPNLSTDELPAHRFLKSVHNITIERGWLRVRVQWGDNVKVFWEAGEEIYNDMDPRQYALVQWLWPRLIQQELDTLKHRLNTHTVRYDRDKLLPSGVSPNVAILLHKDYDAQNCLQLVDRDVVKNLMEEIGGEDLIRFVDSEYSAAAQLIFDGLGFTVLTFENVWSVFSAMLPLI
ncbi:hypothetical protein CY34DRAFT_18913 [Suillus luteus UH-Slu-Lm8-n1]|uniref:Integrase core domain-containing protein n=1 Tax=Suillus luteus UH-Slu-Lm8-n1 TaxID=930992 RepID=A0A0D0AL46_9AGAM|nr:hypothetical protein CY34DRAFT_18913 [Suillus luteus UH-Slu-Lm8-n1]